MPGLLDGPAPIVVDKNAAIAMGKALFWDVQMGSDGQACASCHFHAGADDRGKHIINPGLTHANAATGSTFEPTASANPKSGANYTVNLLDFPFTQFNDPNDRNSGLKFDTDDTASSPGTFAGAFVATTTRLRPFDLCDRSNIHPIFNVNGIGTRRVEPRNTPTMINAVFNFRNFWDGRANNIFNGNNPFGLRDVNATLVKLTGGVPDQNFKVALINSSLASQAVGPALSDFEASCAGRNFGDLGTKLLVRRPLALQTVHAQDSVLASRRFLLGKGLNGTYADMVRAAFNPDFWSIPETTKFPVRKGFTSTTRDSDPVYTQMQANFSLFWGAAIQLYESTLISDQARYDAFAASPRGADGFPTGTQLTDQEKLGLKVFLNQSRDNPWGGAGGGKCINCHKGSDFTGAGEALQAQAQEGGLVERMHMGDGGVALYDNGFYNIGVTRTENDLGVGGTDPFGNPLSFARQYVNFLAGGNPKDPFQVNPCTFEVPFDPNNCSTPPPANSRVAVDGAMKTPGLRNVEFTGPYMHSGGMATLEQVVTAYNRGQNFRNNELDPNIEPLGLTPEEQAGLVAFLKTLTDPRVPNEKAPFDHPQINVPNGHLGDEIAINARNPSKPTIATDDLRLIKATGAPGRSALRAPIHRFDECIGPDPVPGNSNLNNYLCTPDR